MRQRYPALFNDAHGLFYDLILLGGSLASHVPLIVIGALGKYLEKYKNPCTDWYGGEGRRLEAQLTSFDQQTLLTKLPEYFSQDLQAAFANPDAPRLVFMLDTYEALSQDKPQQIGFGRHAADGWIQDLVSACPGVLFVFFGRDALQWDDSGEQYRRRNYRTMLEGNQHRLGSLSKSDADSFLKRAGIWQLQIREAIIASSAGLPFYLSISIYS